MANKPGTAQPKPFKQGYALTAEQLNQIVDMLINRISGGKGINVRTFGGTIIVEDADL